MDWNDQSVFKKKKAADEFPVHQQIVSAPVDFVHLAPGFYVGHHTLSCKSATDYAPVRRVSEESMRRHEALVTQLKHSLSAETERALLAQTLTEAKQMTS